MNSSNQQAQRWRNTKARKWCAECRAGYSPCDHDGIDWEPAEADILAAGHVDGRPFKAWLCNDHATMLKLDGAKLRVLRRARPGREVVGDPVDPAARIAPPATGTAFRMFLMPGGGPELVATFPELADWSEQLPDPSWGAILGDLVAWPDEQAPAVLPESAPAVLVVLVDGEAVGWAWRWDFGPWILDGAAECGRGLVLGEDHRDVARHVIAEAASAAEWRARTGTKGGAA